MTDGDTLHARWARLRFAIIGPLLAAPPRRGELKHQLEALAAREWTHPITGRSTRFGYSTIERWYYTAKNASRDPVGVLRRRVRKDAGATMLSDGIRKVIESQYEAHPNWSYKLHADNLFSILQEEPDLGSVPSYSTVLRFMQARGLRRVKVRSNRDTEGTRRAIRRLKEREVRSYEVTHVHGLWHTDFHEGSKKVLTSSAAWQTPSLFAVLDDHARLGCHAQWYLQPECTETFVHGLSQGFMKRGLCRQLMTDGGPGMIAEETEQGLLDLGIIHEQTLAESPYQNGKMETFWTQVEGRLLAMLEGIDDLSLDLLNEATQAWLELEYNRAFHSEIRTTPLRRFLTSPSVGRPSPDAQTLRKAFRLERWRTQRKSDGTVSIEGHRFELPSRFRQQARVLLRYARWDLSHVDIIDPRAKNVLSPIYPLDKAQNADKRRRALEPNDIVVPGAKKTGEVAPLLRRLMRDYAATGLPPAYIPKNDREEEEP